jgi:hypothetical protein
MDATRGSQQAAKKGGRTNPIIPRYCAWLKYTHDATNAVWGKAPRSRLPGLCMDRCFTGSKLCVPLALPVSEQLRTQSTGKASGKKRNRASTVARDAYPPHQ